MWVPVVNSHYLITIGTTPPDPGYYDVTLQTDFYMNMH